MFWVYLFSAACHALFKKKKEKEIHVLATGYDRGLTDKGLYTSCSYFNDAAYCLFSLSVHW